MAAKETEALPDEQARPAIGWGATWTRTTPRLLGVVAALVVAGSALAFVLAAAILPQQWASRAEIEYRGSSFVETAAIVAESQTMMGAVGQSHGMTAEDLDESFTVVQPTNSEILQLELRHDDPAESLSVLESVTAALLERVAATGTDAQIALVESELERLRSALDERRTAFDRQRRQGADAATTAIAVDDLARRAEQISELELQLVSLQIKAIDEQPILVTEPYLAPDPVGAAPLRTALLGALGGAAVAAMLLALTLRK